MRLDLFLSETLGSGAKQCRQSIEAGDVTVSGVTVLEPRWQLIIGTDEANEVEMRGAPVLGRRVFHRLLLLHKPRGYVCARHRGSAAWCEARGRSPPAALMNETPREQTPTVWDCLPDELRHPRLGCFGRLDKDTTGLLILGTDGGLQSLLMHPSSGCEKVYLARLHPEHPLRPTAEREFAEGVVLASGFRCAAAELEILERAQTAVPGGEARAPVLVRVTLREGKNHQVKRMLGVVGGFVLALHRERVGALSLADYPALRDEGGVVCASSADMERIRGVLDSRVVHEMRTNIPAE